MHPEAHGTEPGGLPCPLQHESFTSMSKACRRQGACTLALEGRVWKRTPVPSHQLELRDSPAHWNDLGELRQLVPSFCQPP